MKGSEAVAQTCSQLPPTRQSLRLRRLLWLALVAFSAANILILMWQYIVAWVYVGYYSYGSLVPESRAEFVATSGQMKVAIAVTVSSGVGGVLSLLAWRWLLLEAKRAEERRHGRGSGAAQTVAGSAPCGEGRSRALAVIKAVACVALLLFNSVLGSCVTGLAAHFRGLHRGVTPAYYYLEFDVARDKVLTFGIVGTLLGIGAMLFMRFGHMFLMRKFAGLTPNDESEKAE